MATPGAFSPAKRRLIAAMLSERDVRSAAAKAKVSERSAHRWMHEPAFKAELEAAERQAIDGAILQLAGLSGSAVQALRQVMSDGEAPAGSRVAAANAALGRLLDLRELSELESRLAAIESKLGVAK